MTDAEPPRGRVQWGELTATLAPGLFTTDFIRTRHGRTLTLYVLL